MPKECDHIAPVTRRPVIGAAWPASKSILAIVCVAASKCRSWCDLSTRNQLHQWPQVAITISRKPTLSTTACSLGVCWVFAWCVRSVCSLIISIGMHHRASHLMTRSKWDRSKAVSLSNVYRANSLCAIFSRGNAKLETHTPVRLGSDKQKRAIEKKERKWYNNM